MLDVFDRNSVTGDPRQTFFNMAFMTHASWDFTSNARGYSWGGIAELYWEQWALRYGRITPPKNPNQLPVDFRIWEHYGDQIELERRHSLFGRPGAVRLLGYQANFVKLQSGLFLFSHDATICQTTLAIGVGEFTDMHQGPIFETRLTGTAACPGHCLHERSLDPCGNECECAYVRDALQIVKGWPKRNGESL